MKNLRVICLGAIAVALVGAAVVQNWTPRSFGMSSAATAETPYIGRLTQRAADFRGVGEMKLETPPTWKPARDAAGFQSLSGIETQADALAATAGRFWVDLSPPYKNENERQVSLFAELGADAVPRAVMPQRGGTGVFLVKVWLSVLLGAAALAWAFTAPWLARRHTH